jgi:hypothetical protein
MIECLRSSNCFYVKSSTKQGLFRACWLHVDLLRKKFKLFRPSVQKLSNLILHGTSIVWFDSCAFYTKKFVDPYLNRTTQKNTLSLRNNCRSTFLLFGLNVFRRFYALPSHRSSLFPTLHHITQETFFSLELFTGGGKSFQREKKKMFD